MEMGIAEVENTYMMQSPWLLLNYVFCSGIFSDSRYHN